MPTLIWSLYKMPMLARYFVILSWLLLASCASVETESLSQPVPKFFTSTVTGEWILEQDGSLMSDPQTSGLTFSDGYLYAVSDASAQLHQVRRLHKLPVNSSQIVEKVGPIQLAKNVAENSCFAKYLEDRPDYEGLIALPNSKTEWLIVTEDASRGNKISAECLDKYANANFTHYPSLLIKIELINNSLMLTGVRVLQFAAQDEVDKRLSGDKRIENEGIEGITITRDGRILLGMEKDANERPRVFELKYESTLFDSLDKFIKVKDSGLLFPDDLSFRSPINGMDVYYPNDKSKGFLIAVARNVNQLWILDLAKQRPASIVDLNLYAPSNTTQKCANKHKIRIAALEGVAVHKQTLYLINDPWKEVYPNNTICPQDKGRYEGFSPLLFRLPIEASWFE